MSSSLTAVSQISEIIDNVVQKAVNEKLTKYAQHIAYKWDIKLSLLMQDLENLENLSASPRDFDDFSVKDGHCKGVLPNGRRCSHKSKKDGYCSKHNNQKKVVVHTITQLPNNVELQHNHLLSECLTKAGCPACEKSKRIPSRENLLIEL